MSKTKVRLRGTKAQTFCDAQREAGLTNAEAAKWLGYDLATIKRRRNGELKPAQRDLVLLRNYRLIKAKGDLCDSLEKTAQSTE